MRTQSHSSISLDPEGIAPAEVPHSLVQKLSNLEALLNRANRSACLGDLSRLLRRLESVVTCSQCHEAYSQAWENPDLQQQIDRVQTEACRSFGLIEKELSRRESDRHDVARYLAAVSHSALKEARACAVDHRSRVLFIGCGARPVSCHALATRFGCQVVGIDIDPECVEAATLYARRLAQSPRLHFELRDGAESEVKGFTHIIVASLVENKHRVLNHLAATLQPDVRVAARYGDGLHRLMNYPLPATPFGAWRSLSIDFNPRGLYQTLYLSRGES